MATYPAQVGSGGGGSAPGPANRNHCDWRRVLVAIAALGPKTLTVGVFGAHVGAAADPLSLDASNPRRRDRTRTALRATVPRKARKARAAAYRRSARARHQHGRHGVRLIPHREMPGTLDPFVARAWQHA